jgi:RecB family exonuclease
MKITTVLLPEKDMSNAELALSVSKAKTFEDCKAKYKFCYMDKLPRIERDFHIFGTFLHEVLEVFHKKMLEDSSQDYSVVLDDSFKATKENYSDKMTPEQFVDALEIKNEYKTILQEEGMPNIVAVEKPFYININNKVLLNGYIDRIQMDEDGVLHVADYKTTKDKKYLKDFFQLITYSYALCLEDDSIKRIRASFILLRHSFEYLTQEYTRDEVISIAEKFLQYANDIEQEKLWRANPQFLCKYCDYIDHCKPGQEYLIKRGQLVRKKNPPGIKKW